MNEEESVIKIPTKKSPKKSPKKAKHAYQEKISEDNQIQLNNELIYEDNEYEVEEEEENEDHEAASVIDLGSPMRKNFESPQTSPIANTKHKEIYIEENKTNEYVNQNSNKLDDINNDVFESKKSIPNLHNQSQDDLHRNFDSRDNSPLKNNIHDEPSNNEILQTQDLVHVDNLKTESHQHNMVTETQPNFVTEVQAPIITMHKMNSDTSIENRIKEEDLDMEDLENKYENFSERNFSESDNLVDLNGQEFAKTIFTKVKL